MTGKHLLARLRSLGQFLIALFYFFFARTLASRAARGFASGDWAELWSRVFLLFLLIAGYAAMAYVFQRQLRPVSAIGLPRRPGWRREVALGVALGWGLMLACVLPIALFGGLRIALWTAPRQWGLLLLDLAVLGLAALGEDVAFWSYPLQRLIDATGPTLATMLLAVLFAVAHLGNPTATSASTLVTALAGVLLATAWQRTRALWVGWGFHFGWNAAMGVVFGLPVSGLTKFSPVIQSRTSGPAWLTGGDYGPEGSLAAVVVLLAGIVVLVRITRDYAYKYAQPVIVPGGIPVDLSGAAQRQHDAAALPSSALVQIAPSTSSSASKVPWIEVSPGQGAVQPETAGRAEGGPPQGAEAER